MIVMQQAVLYSHPQVESFDTEITCTEYHQEKSWRRLLTSLATVSNTTKVIAEIAMIMEKKYINMELNINMDITSEGDKALVIR